MERNVDGRRLVDGRAGGMANGLENSGGTAHSAAVEHPCLYELLERVVGLLQRLPPQAWDRDGTGDPLGVERCRVGRSTHWNDAGGPRAQLATRQNTVVP